jgi:hypothetical protein
MVSRYLLRRSGWWGREYGLRFPQQIRQVHFWHTLSNRTLSSETVIFGLGYKAMPSVPNRCKCRLGLLTALECWICFVVQQRWLISRVGRRGRFV